MAPKLLQRTADMVPAEVANSINALARVRFYDGDLMEALTSRVRKLVRERSSGGLTGGMLVTILSCLAQLNMYDKEVFRLAVNVFAAPGGTQGLENAQRCQLLDALKLVKHTGAEAFIERLSQRCGEERYENAKDELLKRNLQRMYGNTRDLQGASEDVERALLKPRYHKANIVTRR